MDAQDSPRQSQAAPRPTSGATDPSSITAYRGDFREGLLLCLPQLRAFARVLTGMRDRADDLVQDALTRALAAEGRFEGGTNLRAWLMTILRNQWISDLRSAQRRRREALTPDIAALPAAQLPSVELAELGAAMEKLSVSHKEVLLLVAAAGLDHEEAAQVCGCAVGTIKSRLNRARTHLRAVLDGPEGAAPQHGIEPRRGRPVARIEHRAHHG
ncbi:MAG: sigma-70 family RNA polymerase sigma factor [Alphaproteobacteria bacterium]|nr:sigma-70 family RNA polymerase sigma factor [Alphaproteobacteria bacterium]